MTREGAGKLILDVFRDKKHAGELLRVGTLLEAYFHKVGDAGQFGEGLDWLVEQGLVEEMPVGYQLTTKGRQA